MERLLNIVLSSGCSCAKWLKLKLWGAENGHTDSTLVWGKRSSRVALIWTPSGCTSLRAVRLASLYQACSFIKALASSDPAHTARAPGNADRHTHGSQFSCLWVVRFWLPRRATYGSGLKELQVLRFFSVKHLLNDSLPCGRSQFTHNEAKPNQAHMTWISTKEKENWKENLDFHGASIRRTCRTLGARSTCCWDQTSLGSPGARQQPQRRVPSYIFSQVWKEFWDEIQKFNVFRNVGNQINSITSHRNRLISFWQN